MKKNLFAIRMEWVNLLILMIICYFIWLIIRLAPTFKQIEYYPLAIAAKLGTFGIF